MEAASSAPLNILHVFRAPVGGLFRHVVDLARGQVARGHKVGLIADSTTGGARADAILSELARELPLGVSKYPFPRHLGWRDAGGVRHVTERIAQSRAHVIHGHGAKGGAYARLATAPKGTIRVYTPHGGSLHYSATNPIGLLYLGLERVLMARGNLYLFESAYSRDVFRAKVGTPKGVVRVVHNGIGEAEFSMVEPAADATDLLFVGELRAIKGVDVLIEALALLEQQGRVFSVTIVGYGPDEHRLRQQAQARGLAERTHFLAARPAREAFRLGRILVVPSRSESLPYIVLEAAGAGMPVIASKVGGIPEIFGPESGRLVDPDNAAALAQAIEDAVEDPEQLNEFAWKLHDRVRESFSVDAMVDQVLASYRQVLQSA